MLGALCGCGEEEAANETAISYMMDDTDPMLKPSAREILALYQISDKKKYDGYCLRCRRISDVTLIPAKEFRVEAADSWFTADDLERVQAVRALEADFKGWYGTLKEPEAPKKQSVIYRTIADELNRLAAFKAKTKYAVLGSDLMEHSQDLNLYDKREFAQAKNNPQAIVERLEKTVPLKSLKGITVVLYYRPQTYEQQLKYDVSSQLFRTLLTKHGAEVVITADMSMLSL